jgi:hypothetical protein
MPKRDEYHRGWIAPHSHQMRNSLSVFGRSCGWNAVCSRFCFGDYLLAATGERPRSASRLHQTTKLANNYDSPVAPEPPLPMAVVPPDTMTAA